MSEVNLVAADHWSIGEAAQVCYDLTTLAYPTGAPWQLATFQTDLASAHTNYVFAVIADNVVGFVSYTTLFDEAEVTNVAVHPDFQRRGIATQLLQHVFQTLTVPAKVFLEVRQSNLAAQQLYQRCGFTTMTVRKGYYQATGEDALIMRKMIE
ncbi:ribosomal-protein-alanine N-acetyltransferase [Lactobacillus sp.] [Lactiplantibacillus mudanjiangensis]|uniref:ribosomal protein S18-alanine N-acetyltransferase n=1 Tax=Lactiplantibacillus mudanjiangensis TaxID=1296538 RepID=UPI0010149F94|nr:ribosomal protein S18-alanine N-acetyltransferase [Lactiplantibacillus mudanjiangensis]VDG32331.1 ribosomal-protein-alanine N-acetyltransferase [Lactobacillus sp.] [Lactiplantibacillus mudanjiangensis]